MSVPLAGCSSSPLDSGWSSGSKATAVADWNDVDAAVSVASEKMSFALESSETPDETTRRYRLLTTADEPVDVEVLRGVGGSATGSSFGSGDQRFGPTSLTLRCRVGRFGDERREQQFLNAMRQRLGDLMGVDVAPVR
ncbi:MAG: hypothetical protein SFY96_06015 [Planctomycetota bacterium]|nr:hypothetical protein [Planctomycetota bacterium]